MRLKFFHFFPVNRCNIIFFSKVFDILLVLLILPTLRSWEREQAINDVPLVLSVLTISIWLDFTQIAKIILVNFINSGSSVIEPIWWFAFILLIHSAPSLSKSILRWIFHVILFYLFIRTFPGKSICFFNLWHLFLNHFSSAIGILRSWLSSLRFF